MKKNIFYLTLVTTSLFLISIYHFLDRVHSYELPIKKEKLEAIIVFTGGAKRVEIGLKLLQNNYAGQLFISGVSKRVSENDFEKIVGNKISQHHDKIILDMRSTTTKENVENTTLWLTKNNISLIYLVTEQFHLPRSILIFQRKMPMLKIIPWPVRHYDIYKQLDDQNGNIFNVIVKEYFKFYSTIVIFELEKFFSKGM